MGHLTTYTSCKQWDTWTCVPHVCTQQHLQISCARSSVQAALPENVHVPTWWPQSRAWSWWCLATGRTETRSHPPAKKDDAYGESTSQPPAKKGDVAYSESTSQMPENECAFKTPLHPSVNKCMHSLPWQIDTPITSICKTPFEVTPYLKCQLVYQYLSLIYINCAPNGCRCFCWKADIHTMINYHC